VISGSSRGLRGGAWYGNDNNLRSSNRDNFDPAAVPFDIGFRVASVPEPTSILLSMFAGGMMLIRRKR
jgi:formylglycine-generating enzyme required for sulfatase activity